MTTKWTRRRFLRGAVAGAGSVCVGLPLLEIFLNDHGDALASGGPLPRRFGTWFWGCGMNPGRWNPTGVGADYELSPELGPVAALREDLNVLSGFSVFLAGEPNLVHYSGFIGTLTGEAPEHGKPTLLPTLDVVVGDRIGGSTRFKSLEAAATANPKHSYSQRGHTERNPAEPTALGLYQRVFGAGFVDPNASDWSPDPEVLLRQSALSIVREDRKRIERQLGAADRARLEAYFTSLRQLERQLELQLSKPPPLEACRVPGRPDEIEVSRDIATVWENHRLMAELLALALACDQTRVFNMVFSNAASTLHKPGSKDTHHTLTHEEPRDAKLGYQVEATEFVMRSMEAWALFVNALKSIPEGDGTLLDNCLVLAHSDQSDANSHSIEGLPIMLAGRAGGAIRTGLHIRGDGEPTTRVGLTVQQAMGVPVDRFGVRQNETSRPLSALIV